MTPAPRWLYQIEATLPASLEAVESLVGEFRRRSAADAAAASRFPAELMLREALVNAVVHGCRQNPARKVFCKVRRARRRLVISVRDEGEGFDWRSAPPALAGAADCSGRGVEILRAYSTRVRFNTRGNGVTIVRKFNEEPHG